MREFHRLANGVHDKIELELRISPHTIEFLDVRVSVKGRELSTNVYSKPTDSKAYLHFSSDHPLHIKTSIPSSLAMRARRICSSNSDFIKQTQEIRKNLISRGYPERMVKNGIKRVGNMDRTMLLEKGSGTGDRQGVPLTVTYSSHLPNIGKILKKKKHLLTRSERLTTIF